MNKVRIKSCNTADEKSSQELKKESTSVLCLQFDKANLRKTYQSHKHAVLRLTNHDKDNQMLLTDLLAMNQMICYCQ